MSRQPHFVVFLAASFVVIAGLKYAEPFLVPVLFGATLAAISSPVATWVTRRGLPAVAGALAALVVDVALLALVGVTLTLASGELRAKLPAYVARLSDTKAAFAAALSSRGIPVDTSALHPDGMSFLGDAAASLAGAASTTAVILVVVFFMLCEFTGLGDKIRHNLADPAGGIVRVDRIVREVQTYLLVKTLTSFMVAVLAYAVLKLLRMELALFLALALFLLHFIPNVGPAIATILAVLVAFASRGLGTAIGVAVGFVLINLLVGTFIEPRVLGRTLGLSPLFVLLGMLFWGWLWGASGALLSVPLMMVAKIILENSKDFAWVARLVEPATEADEVAEADVPELAPISIPSRRPATTNPLMMRPSIPMGLGSSTRGPLK